MTQLTPHFSIADLVRSHTAERLGIDNRPNQEVVEHLGILARGLEDIRTSLCLIGGMIQVSSGYRCPKLNYKIGGSINSDHMRGYAADFTCASYGSPMEVIDCLQRSNLMFDKLIRERSWVHVSFAPAKRREILLAVYGEDGDVHYRRLG